MPLLVVQTYYCEPPRGRPPYFEIHLAPLADEALDDPRPRRRDAFLAHRCHTCLVVVTADRDLYIDALDAEGTTHRLVAQWHREPPYSVLDRLEAA